MKTVILTMAAVLGFGIGSVYAAEGQEDDTIADTYFTELPGVVATVPGLPSTALATNQHGGPAAVYVTGHGNAVSLFPPQTDEGTGN
jgi:hypothetical protein